MKQKPTLFICHWNPSHRKFFRYCFGRFSKQLEIVGDCSVLDECKSWLVDNTIDFVLIALPDSIPNKESLIELLSILHQKTEFITISPDDGNQLVAFHKRFEAVAILKTELV